MSALATVLRGAAIPYGYTVTVWTSGMMLTRTRGLPSTAEVFLFMVGAVSAFGALELAVRALRGVPFDPSRGALRSVGAAHFVAVGVALGVATLIAHVDSFIAWPLGAFAATATYLALATFALSVAHAP